MSFASFLQTGLVFLSKATKPTAASESTCQVVFALAFQDDVFGHGHRFVRYE